MSKISSTHSIRYTFIGLDKEEHANIVEIVEQNNYEDSIYGFISDNKFWHPSGEEHYEGHWTTPIVKAYPDEYMVILVGPPNEVGRIMTEIVAYDNYYVTAYDTWNTDVDHVAVVTEIGPD